VIIWINGGFGAGKTTLAKELHRRLPDAVVYDAEDVGLMLWEVDAAQWRFPAPAELAGIGGCDGAVAAQAPHADPPRPDVADPRRLPR
jgi:hypothetical protein